MRHTARKPPIDACSPGKLHVWRVGKRDKLANALWSQFICAKCGWVVFVKTKLAEKPKPPKGYLHRARRKRAV